MGKAVAYIVKAVGILLIVSGLVLAGYTAKEYYEGVLPAITAVSKAKLSITPIGINAITNDYIELILKYNVEIPEPEPLDGTRITLLVGDTRVFSFVINAEEKVYEKEFPLKLYYEEIIDGRNFTLKIEKNFPGLLSLNLDYPIQREVNGERVTLNTTAILKPLVKNIFTPAVMVEQVERQYTVVHMVFYRPEEIKIYDIDVRIEVFDEEKQIMSSVESLEITGKDYSIISFNVAGLYSKADVVYEKPAEYRGRILLVKIYHAGKNILLNEFYIVLQPLG